MSRLVEYWANWRGFQRQLRCYHLPPLSYYFLKPCYLFWMNKLSVWKYGDMAFGDKHHRDILSIVFSNTGKYNPPMMEGPIKEQIHRVSPFTISKLYQNMTICGQITTLKYDKTKISQKIKWMKIWIKENTIWLCNVKKNILEQWVPIWIGFCSS